MLLNLIAAWPGLPPHIREASFTLVDSVAPALLVEGAPR